MKRARTRKQIHVRYRGALNARYRKMKTRGRTEKASSIFRRIVKQAEIEEDRAFWAARK